MSEESEHLPDSHSDEEMEELLRQLKPAKPHAEFLRELERDHERISTEVQHDPRRPQWKKVIPLTVASVFVMLGYASFQYGPVVREATTIAEADPPAAPVESTSSAPVPRFDNFQPVSSQGYLVNTSSGGIIETNEGPREQMNLEYRDAYHWHNPDTGTNIRFFQPRSESVIVPLQTD